MGKLEEEFDSSVKKEVRIIYGIIIGSVTALFVSFGILVGVFTDDWSLLIDSVTSILLIGTLGLLVIEFIMRKGRSEP